MPRRKTATAVLTRAMAPPPRRVKIDAQPALALLRQLAVVALRRLAARPRKAGCPAQSTPALAQQKQPRRKRSPRTRRCDGEQAGHRRCEAEMQQKGERSRHNPGTFAARVECCRKAVNQKNRKNHVNEEAE